MPMGPLWGLRGAAMRCARTCGAGGGGSGGEYVRRQWQRVRGRAGGVGGTPSRAARGADGGLHGASKSARPRGGVSQAAGGSAAGAGGPAPQALRGGTEAQWALADKLAAPVGFAAGVFGSVVGVGGGTIIVPALTSCAGVAQKVISGTSLVAVLATSAASSAAYATNGLIDSKVRCAPRGRAGRGTISALVLRTAKTAFVGCAHGCTELTRRAPRALPAGAPPAPQQAAAIVAATALLSASFGARATATLSTQQLKRFLGFFLVSVAPLIPLKKAIYQGRKDEAVVTGELDAARACVLAATGAVAGFASGLLGIGGGTIVTPLLALTTDLPQAGAVATSLAAMFLPSCVALATHASLGNVRWRMGAFLAMGTALGAGVGSRAALSAPDGALEGVFALGMAFLGARTLKWV